MTSTATTISPYTRRSSRCAGLLRARRSVPSSHRLGMSAIKFITFPHNCNRGAVRFPQYTGIMIRTRTVSYCLAYCGMLAKLATL